MLGLSFVRMNRLALNNKAIFLPHAGLIECIFNNIQLQSWGLSKELKKYIPNLMEVDIYLIVDFEKFIIFFSKESSSNIPAHGGNIRKEDEEPTIGYNIIDGYGCIEIEHNDTHEISFRNLGFAPGPILGGRAPFDHKNGTHEERKTIMDSVGAQGATAIINWAVKMHARDTNSKIFLSHKGINKSLVNKIDQALRQLNIKTWLDSDDLPTGTPLMRGISGAFSECIAAVFFISKEFSDENIIAAEINKAMTEQVKRNGQFKIIPLVLVQHGGVDDNVPSPLQDLSWRKVEDSEIVPRIIEALPAQIQMNIKYVALK